MNNNDLLAESLANKAKERGWGAKELVAYLLKTNMISTSAQNAYLAVEAYPDALKSTESEANPRGVKIRAVWEICDRLNLSESTVLGYIAHHSSRFWE
jgi:DNA-binding CsgD family transcriptional regulator